jgi:hypothetical protein
VGADIGSEGSLWLPSSAGRFHGESVPCECLAVSRMSASVSPRTAALTDEALTGENRRRSLATDPSDVHQSKKKPAAVSHRRGGKMPPFIHAMCEFRTGQSHYGRRRETHLMS